MAIVRPSAVRPSAADAAAEMRVTTYRHSVIVRITHWVSVLSMTMLLMSGLMIFNAHPALYWGNISDFDHPAFSIDAVRAPDGHPRGQMLLFGHRIDTTGVLGLTHGADGEPLARAFPPWMTIPGYYSLADGRQWHFFFAWLFVLNGLFYLGYSLLGRHVWRDLIPSRSDLRHLPASILEHARLHFPRGEAARRYNVLQRLAYLLVIFVLIPTIVLAGCAMSPRLDAGFPWLVTLFGGRQSARTVHFIVAWLLVAFVLVHVAMVILSGPWNNIRSMITGRYVIRTDGDRT
jgi:thiosulfate reductase cytochrome b subunit